jgi:hypothetical protein
MRDRIAGISDLILRSIAKAMRLEEWQSIELEIT